MKLLDVRLHEGKHAPRAGKLRRAPRPHAGAAPCEATRDPIALIMDVAPVAPRGWGAAARHAAARFDGSGPAAQRLVVIDAAAASQTKRDNEWEREDAIELSV